MRVTSVADLAAAVRTRRRELDLTQEELGDRAGVSTKWIYRLERGGGNVELGRCLRVIRALDLEIVLETSGDDVDGLVDG